MDTKRAKLSDKEEKQLISDAQAENPEAISRLVDAFQGLVIDYAKPYRERGLDWGDLKSEGNVGLINAIKHFDFKKGNRLSTYAVPWIINAIKAALSRESKHIKRHNSYEEILEETGTEPQEIIDNLDQLHSKSPPIIFTKQAPKTKEGLSKDIKSWEDRGLLHYLRYDHDLQYILSDRPYPQTPELIKMLKAMGPNENAHKILSKWSKKVVDLSAIQDAFSEYFMYWAGQVERGGKPTRTPIRKTRKHLAKLSRERKKIIRLWKEWAREARKTYKDAIGCGCIAAYFRLLNDLNREAEFDRVYEERDKRVRKRFEMGPPSDYKLYRLYGSLINHLKGKTETPHKDIKDLLTWVPIRDTKDFYNKTVKKKLREIANWEKELNEEVNGGKSMIEEKTPGFCPWHTDTIVIPMEVWKGVALPYFSRIYKRWRLKGGEQGQKAEPYYEGIMPRGDVEGKAVIFRLGDFEMKTILDRILLQRDYKAGDDSA
jgi:RNA polymerase sigma factor (sigma-70 family)